MREKPWKLKEHTGKLKPSVREQPGKPREQPKMKESVLNASYKRDWFVYEEKNELEKLRLEAQHRAETCGMRDGFSMRNFNTIRS